MDDPIKAPKRAAEREDVGLVDSFDACEGAVEVRAVVVVDFFLEDVRGFVLVDLVGREVQAGLFGTGRDGDGHEWGVGKIGKW